MARTIDILIRIRQAGKEALDEAAAGLEELKEAVSGLEVAVVDAMREEFERIGEITGGIADDVERIRKALIGTIDRTMDNAAERLDTAAGSTQRIAGVLETFFARTLVGAVAGVFGLFGVGFRDAAKSAVTLGRLFSSNILASLQSLLPLAEHAARLSMFTLDHWVTRGRIALTMFSVGSSALVAMPIVLSQTLTLARRLLGLGHQSNTVVGQASNLVTSVNTSLHSAYFTWAQVLMPSVLGGLMYMTTGVHGLLALIPFALNTSVSVFGNILSRIRHSALSFLGVGRGAMFVLFHQFRSFAREVFPLLGKFVPTIRLIANALHAMKPLIQTLTSKKNVAILRYEIERIVENLGIFSKGGFRNWVFGFLISVRLHLDSILGFLYKIVYGPLGLIGKAASGIMKFAAVAGKAVVLELYDMLSFLAGRMLGLASEMRAVLTSVFSSVIGASRTLYSFMMGTMVGLFSYAYEGFQKFSATARTVAGHMAQAFRSAFSAVRNVFSSLWGFLKGAMSRVWDLFSKKPASPAAASPAAAQAQAGRQEKPKAESVPLLSLANVKGIGPIFHGSKGYTDHPRAESMLRSVEREKKILEEGGFKAGKATREVTLASGEKVVILFRKIADDLGKSATVAAAVLLSQAQAAHAKTKDVAKKLEGIDLRAMRSRDFALPDAQARKGEGKAWLASRRETERVREESDRSSRAEFSGRVRAKAGVEKPLREIFDFEKVLKKKTETGKNLSQELWIYLRNVLDNSFSPSAFAKFDISHYHKSIATFLSKVLNVPRRMIDPKATNFNLLLVGSTIKDAIDATVKSGKSGIKEGDSFGSKFLKSISASLKKEAPAEMRSAVALAMKSLEGVFRQSVPNTRASGEKILKQVAEGMREATREVDKAAKEGAERISGYYPSSLAKKAPLRRLPVMGWLIGSQLAAGIVSAQPLVAYAALSIANSVASAFMSIVGKIAALASPVVAAFRGIFSRISPYITEIRDTLREAFRIGDSPANVALVQQFQLYGASATEATTAISRMQRLIQGSASSEDVQRLESLGISLDSVRNSTEPVVAMMSELSGVVASAAPGSAELNTALELLGTTVSSNLVFALRGGSESFRRDFADMMHGSAFLTGELQEKIMAFDRAKGMVFASIRNTVAAALNEVLPSITERIESLYSFLRANAGKIAGVAMFVVRALQAVAAFVFSLLRNLVEAPGRVFGPLLELLAATGRTVVSIADSAARRFFESIRLVGPPLFAVVTTIFRTFVDILREIVPSAFARVVSLARENFPALFESAGELLASALVWLGDAILEILASLGRWFVVATQRIGLFFGVGFDTLVEWLEGKIDHFVSQIVVFFADALTVALEEIPGLSSIAEFLFGEDVVESLRNFAAAGDEVSRDLARDLEQAFSRLEAVTRVSFGMPEAPSFRNADSQDADSQAFEASMRRAADTARAAWSSLQGDLANLAREGAAGIANVVGPEAMAEYRDMLSGFAAEVGSIMERMPQDVQDSFASMTAALSSGALEDAVSEAEDLFARVAEAAENAANGVAESTGGFWASLGSFFEGISENSEKVSGTLSSFGQAFSDLYEMSGQRLKAFFIAFKAMSLSQVVIETAKGVMGALAATPPGPWNTANAAAIAAAGTVQAAKIAAEMFTGFLSGGIVPGPTQGRDGRIIAVDGGEFVVPSSAVRRLVGEYGAGVMETLRRGLLPVADFSSLTEKIRVRPLSGPLPGFLSGGFVGASPAPAAAASPAQAAQQAINIVNVPDPNMLQQFVFSSAGQRTLLNFMSNNASELRRIVRG